MHVHVSGPVHRNYEQRMLSALDSYRKRMEWLQKGSRELFGTIIEDQVCILIDTSSSMASRLFLVKDKLYRLMQEQLRHKIKFNLIKFDSRTQAWRDRLVDCNTHNLDNAWHWVKGLSTGGSTNTLAALKLALSDPQCHAIYLLTDGRPDQPPSSILAQIHLHSPVPVHTISFNCADNEANEFLYKLAQETGGRFHYFSEDGYDISGPRPYESQDLCLLREEIEHGLADLKKVTLVRNECAQLDWYGSNIGRSCSRDHSHSSTGSLRPSSANPTPPRTSRPASARARPATVRVRPSSAKILHSSYKDYIVSSACKNIPQRSGTIAEKRKVPFGETRASILRLNLRKKTSSNWILPETREYLTRKQEDFRKPRRKGPKTRRILTKEPEQSDDDLPIRKWLKKHGLVARKLTILDALAPTIIPHSTKYVPILDKHILSKVFDQVLPLAHTSGSDRDEVQLVNPQGVNLKSYEARLEIALEGYKRKLDELVFSALSDRERLSYDGDKIPSFEANRESMMSDLEKHDWPVGKEEIELLDKEIQQAEVFLQQSKDLRKASEQAAKEIAESQRRARQEAERKRMEEVMSKPTTHVTPPSSVQHPGNKNRLRNHKVLARNEVDGFFYPGIVSRGLNSRYVEVDFNDFDRQVVPVRYVIPVEGARPCPSLKVGDYVLVKSLVPREDEDDLLTDSLCCYVPGIVQVLPLKRSQTSKCYTILRFNGKKITSLRNDLVKISKARYTFACRYIRDSLLSAYRSTSPFGIQPSAKHQPARITITPEGHRSSSRGSSTSSKHRRSRSRSRSHSHSRSQSLSPSGDHSRSRSPSGSHSGSKGRSGSHSGSRSSSRSRNSSLSPSPTLDKLDGKKGIDSSSSSEDEYDEKDNKTDYSDKVKGQMDVLTDQEKRLEALREHLVAEQEKQRKQNKELENKRNELQEQQQRFIQTQLDDQREKQEKFQEEQKQLQRQQEELLKRQREQQEQLLMQQHTQTQSLNLQQQQLVQQLANMVQQQTESATPQAHRTPLLSPVSSAPSSPRRSTRTSPGISPRHSAATSPRSSVKSAPSSSAEGTPGNSRLSSRALSRPSSAKQSSSKSNSRKSSRPSSAHADEEHESDSSLSSISSSSSSSSLSSASSKGSNNDSTAEDEKHKGPPEIQFHMNGDDEACLLTKGTHGLLISRKPLDQDPAVDTRQLPRPVKVGDEVLARWSDEGWYYRGTIQQDCQDGSYFVEDSVGDLEQIHRSDIITDEDDANNVIKVGDPVVGLHPSFSFSYAPGVVISEEGDSMYGIRYYDGIEGVIPRDELYKLTDEKFESVCNYILTCEESLVGQAVVARNDQDGLFHLGSVRERVGNGRQYIIEWPDQTVQLQSSGYMFGAHTKRHPLAIGDRVLALSDPAAFVHMPGWITGSNGRRLVVKFCNGKSSSHVDPLNCYWLSRDYYDRVVEDYKKKGN